MDRGLNPELPHPKQKLSHGYSFSITKTPTFICSEIIRPCYDQHLAIRVIKANWKS